MIGRMVGFALGSGDTFPCFFSTFVLKHLLGIPLRLEVGWFDIGSYCSACTIHRSLESPVCPVCVSSVFREVCHD